MYFICDYCGYQFECESEVKQCPDCGKHKVRLATETEIKEYIERKKS